MNVYTRGGTAEIEKPFEKPVILPMENGQDPGRHAWADARFAIDIMAEPSPSNPASLREEGVAQ